MNPSKKAVGVSGNPRAERLAELTADTSSSAPKLSKRTEWGKDWTLLLDTLIEEMESYVELPSNMSYQDELFTRLNKHGKDFISNLLHQRDNEIREWANDYVNESKLYTPKELWGYIKQDDLLTYLSKEDK